jgi:hypothetical protein
MTKNRRQRDEEPLRMLGRTGEPQDHCASQDRIQHRSENRLPHGRTELIEKEVVGLIEQIGDRPVFHIFGDRARQGRMTQFDGLGQHQIPEHIREGKPIDDLTAGCRVGDLPQLVENPHEGDDHQAAPDQVAGVCQAVDQRDLKDRPIFLEGFHGFFFESG